LRDELYGVRYLPEQLRIINELLVLSGELTMNEVPPNMIFEDGATREMMETADASTDDCEIDPADMHELLEEDEEDEEDEEKAEQEEERGDDENNDEGAKEGKVMEFNSKKSLRSDRLDLRTALNHKEKEMEEPYPLFCPVFTGQNRPYVWGTGVGPKPPREKLTGENPRK